SQRMEEHYATGSGGGRPASGDDVQDGCDPVHGSGSVEGQDDRTVESLEADEDDVVSGVELTVPEGHRHLLLLTRGPAAGRRIAVDVHPEEDDLAGGIPGSGISTIAPSALEGG